MHKNVVLISVHIVNFNSHGKHQDFFFGRSQP